MAEDLKIPLTLAEENLETEALKIIEIIRPNWMLNRDNIGSKVFTDGITNKLVGIFLKENPEEMVIVKIYGSKTDLMIDRKSEIGTMKFLHSKKFGPELYGIFENGISYEYVPGVTLDGDSCRAEKVFQLVASQMATMHSFEFDDSQYPSHSVIWEKLRKFNDLGQEALKAQPDLCSRFEKFGVGLGWGEKAIKELEEIIVREKMPLGFSHNDLLLGNIVYNEKKSTVSFIDFEYAGPNYVPFDIANHFCEFAGIDEVDYSKCPDDQFKLEWIKVYLKTYRGGEHQFTSDELKRWVDLCTPLAHLMWILWSIVQAAYSSIDFDFVEYLGIRLPEYKKYMVKLRE